MAENIKYHLQRWRLAFQGIISRIIGQRWLRILWGFISARVVSSMGQRWRRTISSIRRWRLAIHIIIFRVVGQRWLRLLWGVISRDDGWENHVSFLLSIVSSLGQRWRLSISCIISRDDGVLFKVSSPEITAGKTRYHLYYIESFRGQRWLRILWGIISRDNG